MALKCPSCQAPMEQEAETCFECGHSEHVIRQGTIIGGRYEVLSRLGKGGMGAVYKAHDKILDETVALKVLRADLEQRSELAKRFRSEIKLARKVTHPNVCRIYEYGEEQSRRYISMELIEGVDLKHLTKQQGPLPPDDLYDVAIKIAKGLEAIHKVGVIHRDLKTSNIMRDQAGDVRLMDFGIAKSFEAEGTGATATGNIVGTPEYMSPEQARGDKVGFPSDIYAFAIVVYELATGQVPFRAESPVATILKHIHEPPSLETGVAADRIPEPLRRVLAKALAKDPEKRYASARDLIVALRDARSRSLPDATPTPMAFGAPAVAMAASSDTMTDALPTPVPAVTPLPRRAIAAARAPAASAARAPVIAPRRSPSRTDPTMTAVGAPPVRVETARPPERTSAWPWIMAAVAVAAIGLAAFFILVIGPSRVPETAQSSAPAERPVQATRPPVVREPAPAPSNPSAAAPEAPQRPAAPPPTAPAPREAVPRRPAETPRAAVAAPVSVPPPAEPPRPAPAPVTETGALKLLIRPWAEVAIDGTPMGTTPLKPLSLTPGAHVVRLSHPDYRPLQRRVTVKPGETTVLQVDLTEEAFKIDRR